MVPPRFNIGASRDQSRRRNCHTYLCRARITPGRRACARRQLANDPLAGAGRRRPAARLGAGRPRWRRRRYLRRLRDRADQRPVRQSRARRRDAARRLAAVACPHRSAGGTYDGRTGASDHRSRWRPTASSPVVPAAYRSRATSGISPCLPKPKRGRSQPSSTPEKSAPVDRAGLAGVPTADVIFDDVQPIATAAAKLYSSGADADGRSAARMRDSRRALAAILDMTTTYAQERVAFGKPLSKFQAIQHNLARLAGEAAAATDRIRFGGRRHRHRRRRSRPLRRGRVPLGRWRPRASARRSATLKALPLRIKCTAPSASRRSTRCGSTRCASCPGATICNESRWAVDLGRRVARPAAPTHSGHARCTLTF